MIQNKTTAIILAILTFIIVSIILVSVIFYIFGYPISSIPQHQTYVLFAVLVSAVIASFVYGRGSKERASKVSLLISESLGFEVRESDVWKVLHTIEQMPPSVVNKYVSLNINAVEEFEDQIKIYKTKLSDMDLLKIKKISETPVKEIQDLLSKIYAETNLEQFKILAEPEAESLIRLNRDELKRILFD